MTKVIIVLFVAVLLLHIVAALLTYLCIDSGRFVESNPTTATLQIYYGLTPGLLITLVQGTVLSIIPLMTYLGTVKFAQSNRIKLFKKQEPLTLIKYFFFPLALSILVYLMLIASADVIHDTAMLLSNGKINTWTF
jgi:hypothetical protein